LLWNHYKSYRSKRFGFVAFRLAFPKRFRRSYNTAMIAIMRRINMSSPAMQPIIIPMIDPTPSPSSFWPSSLGVSSTTEQAVRYSKGYNSVTHLHTWLHHHQHYIPLHIVHTCWSSHHMQYNWEYHSLYKICT